MGHRKFFYLLLVTLCLAVASGSIGLLRPVAVERVERIALSFHNATLPTPGEQKQIVLVLAEEPTFHELGRWPWSRKHHAQLLGKLGLARAVLLDIVMPEASTPDADALLAAVVKAMGNVVAACHLANDPSGGERLIYPYPALLDAAAKVGITNVNPDVDGYMRSIRPIWEIEGQALASFPMAALSLLADTPPSLHPADHGYALHVDGRQLPLDDFGNLWVQTGTDAIKRYEYRDVLNGVIPPETFRDKIVVVGVAASGASDFHLVADRFSAEEMPGAEFNAKALSSMLFGNPPARLSPLVSALLAVTLALAGGLLGTRRPALAYPGVMVAGTVYFLGVHALFVTQARWADSAWPLLAMAGTFLVVQGLRYFFLHQDWELQTFSLNKIVNMNPQTIGQFKEFDELLNSAWPDIAGNTGVHLVNASVTADELDEHFLGKTDEQLAVARPGPQGFKEGLALPVPHGDRGTRYVLLGWDRPVGMETLQPLAAVILSTAWFFTNMKEAADSKAMLFRTIRSVFRALDFRDPITGGHSNRVSSLALEIMAHMKLKDVKQVEDIYLGALVHDVGKIGIPDSMLQKEGKLTAEEFCFIKTHPEIGMEIMKSVGLPEESLRTMAEHHERFDGSGYPARLSGKEISLGGRITAVADVFDALTNDRPYRVGWPEKRACDYILGMRGVQFDPDVVDAFIDLKNRTGKS
jgi:putative nucleotidyltransferase with HDIG domain